jgi:hypothetical protein
MQGPTRTTAAPVAKALLQHKTLTGAQVRDLVFYPGEGPRLG